MNKHESSASKNDNNSTTSNSSSNKQQGLGNSTLTNCQEVNNTSQAYEGHQENFENLPTTIGELENMQKSQGQPPQHFPMMSPQMASVMSSSKAETKSGLRSPISSPLATRKNRGLPPVSPKSTPPLARKHYPLAYNASTGTISTPITIPAVPPRMMAAIGSSPASSLSLSSATSSPSSSPPPPPLPSRAPKFSSSGNVNGLLNESPTATKSLVNAKPGKSQISGSPKNNAQNKIDLDKLLAQQKELEEKTAAVQASSKLDASFYDAEIEMMNKYLKSLPDYSELDRKLHKEFQECEDLYDKLKKKQSAPLSKSNSQQSVLETKNKLIPQCPDQTLMNNGLTKSSSTNFQIPSNVGNHSRLHYPSIFQQKPKLQRSISSSNMPFSSANSSQQQQHSLSGLQRSQFFDSHQPLEEEKNSSLNGSNLSLNKQMLNDFWADNLAQKQKRQTPKGALWNFEKICNPTVGAAGAPLKVDAQTAKKLAIFDPTVAEAAQKELHKPAFQPANKLQKIASMSQLDMKVRQAVTKEDLYKLICNEPSSPKALDTTSQNFISKVPVKVVTQTSNSSAILNKSMSMTHVPQAGNFSPSQQTPLAPFNQNLRRSTSKTHIPCYMKHLPSLSRSTSNSAILLPAESKPSMDTNTNRCFRSNQPTMTNSLTTSASTYNETIPSSPKNNETASANPLRGLLKSLSSSNVYGATKYSPFYGNKQQPTTTNELSFANPIPMTTSTITTATCNEMKGSTALNDEIMMLRQQQQHPKQTLKEFKPLRKENSKQNVANTINNKISATTITNADCPSLERKSEKSNSTISTNSVTVTNCCTTHLPQLTKLTSSFHIPASIQDKPQNMAGSSTKGGVLQRAGDNSTPAAGMYKISKTQSAAHLELSKRQKDADNKIEKSFNDIMKKCQQKPTPNSATTSTTSTTTSSSAVGVKSSPMPNNLNNEKEPIETNDTTKQNTLANHNSKVSENLTTTPLCNGNLSQIPKPLTNLTQISTKKSYPIGKSNSTSQIPMASFQRPQILQTIPQQHVVENMQQNNMLLYQPQQKKTFLNWTSFACNTNDPNYQHNQQHKLQQCSSATNVAKKLQHFQHPGQQQQHQLSSHKPCTGLANFLQKNPNKENKYQQYQPQLQQHVYNSQQQCLQNQQPPSAYVYQSKTKNPLTHSASFSTVQRPVALQMHLGQPLADNATNFSNMITQHNNHPTMQHPQQPLERKLLQTFDPYYTKSSEQKYYQQNAANPGNLNQTNSTGKNVAAAAGGVGFNRYQQNFVATPQQQQQQQQHPLMQSSSASAIHFYQTQQQQQHPQMHNSTQVFQTPLMYQQHVNHQQQQQQQQSQQHPLQQSSSMILNHTQTTNQMSKSAIGLHYVEVDS